jgi:hypothetical protein
VTPGGTCESPRPAPAPRAPARASRRGPPAAPPSAPRSSSPSAPAPRPSRVRPTPTRHSADQLAVQKFYCYATDACLAIADPARNPEGRVVFIIDVGDFGWKNFDLQGSKTLFGMMSVSAQTLGLSEQWHRA